MKQTFFRCFLLVCALCWIAAARGGEYPDRPVRLIIPFAPGGASDFGGRLVGAGLTDIFGQQFVIDNRGGASGLIATEIAVRAHPDGYTLFLGNVNTMAINPFIQKMKVDPLKDLVAIAPVATYTPMLPTFMNKREIDEEGIARYIATVPLGRLNQPEDIARTAVFLASDDAAMITGACIEVDGGRCI